MSSIWSHIKRVIIVLHFSNLDDLKKMREAIKDVGLNINDCEIIAVVANKKEKDMLSEISSVTYLNEKDLTFFRKLKNENMTKLAKRSFDAVFFIGDFSKRIIKITQSIQPQIRVGINSEIPNCSVYLNTSEISPAHLINFAKQTLEKTI